VPKYTAVNKRNKQLSKKLYDKVLVSAEFIFLSDYLKLFIMCYTEQYMRPHIIFPGDRYKSPSSPIALRSLIIVLHNARRIAAQNE
jgi:hypothetical protein